MKRNDNLPLNMIDKMNSRVSMIVSAVVLAVVCLVFNQIDYHMIRKPAEEAYEMTKASQDEQETGTASGTRSETVSASATVVAVGDNLVTGDMLRSGQSEEGAWDYSHLYANVAGRIRAADLAIVNQETPLVSDHSKVSGSAPYASPAELGDALAAAGFDVLTCATEYMAAGGDEWMADTLSYAAAHPELKITGLHAANDSALQTVDVNGIKIAILNYVIPITGQTVNLGAATGTAGSVPEYYWDDNDGVYYVYNEASDEWYASDTEPVAAPVTTSSASTEGEYSLNVMTTSEVSEMVSQAKASSDCVIFCAHWGKGNEPMPTEYQKQWASFLLQQGVDVLIGSYPHVLSPYCTLEDESGNSMLVYYSLGNFAAEGQTLKQLLGGMGTFTIQKTGTGDDVSVTITNPDLELVTTHYDYDSGTYGTYLVSDYPQSLASSNSVISYYGEDFSVENLQTKADEILSMMVEPSSGTNMLSYTFDSSGNLYDADGNSVTDTDSITSSEYYANLG